MANRYSRSYAQALGPVGRYWACGGAGATTVMEDRVVNETRRNRPAVRGSASDDGLTIVELLLALVIVMIVFAALASTIIASFASIRNTEARSRAVALANEAVEEMASVSWNQLGMATKDDPTFPHDEWNDELIVWLKEELNPAVPHPDDQDEPVDRDGIDYQVERWVTWVDEDDEAGLKRIVAIVKWDVGGETSTVRSESLRAPDPDELFTLEINAITALTYPDNNSATTLDPSTGEDGLRNSERIDVTVELGDEEAKVQLRFQDRDGNTVVRTGADTGGGTVERVWQIEVNSTGPTFAHGRTAFTVFATGPDGDVASDTAMFRFYQDVVIQEDTIVLKKDGEPVDKVEVNLDGETCGEVTMEVDVHGMTAGEATPDADGFGGLRVLWPDGDDDFFMGLLEAERFGGRFVGEIRTVSHLNLVAGASGLAEVDIVADRLTGPPVSYDDLSYVIEVEVVAC